MARPATANPAHEVLADLLLAAVEADRVGETYALLAELVGEERVRTAHRVVFNRLSNAVAAAAGAGPTADAPNPDGGTLRHTARGTPSEGSGARAEPSGSALSLVRRLPDPSRRGPEGPEGPAGRR